MKPKNAISRPLFLDVIKKRAWIRLYLEGLGIPILDANDRGHVAEVVGQFFKLLNSKGKTDG